ncbi:MAG TPA: hemolysin family protein [Stellaceae bacterium]|nr:hemolysin family protein [Stellaceae bacterium]
MGIFEGAVILLLLLLNGFLAMSEMAIVSARRGRLERLAAGGRADARLALALSEDPSRFLAAVQIGMTLIGILAGALSGALLADRIEAWLGLFPAIAPYGKPVAIGIVVVAVTYLSLVIGELVPKQIALKEPEAIALRIARPVTFFARLAAPLGWTLDLSTKFILRFMGLRPDFERLVTEEDIESLIRRAERSGVLHKIEREMVEGVLDLENRAVRTIMTPRPDIAWVDLAGPKEAMVKTIQECPYAQLLASRGSIDEMAGVIRKQDLLEQFIAGVPLELEKLLQAPLMVPEGASILRTIDLFRKTPVNTAVVVDEYGTIQGIVTRTDLLEAVAGDLPDVDVESEPKVIKRDDGSLLIDAAISMSEIVGLNGFQELPGGDFVTLAGFVLARLGHMPKTGDQFVWHGWRFQVAAMDRQRIDKVLVRPA